MSWEPKRILISDISKAPVGEIVDALLTTPQVRLNPVKDKDEGWDTMSINLEESGLYSCLYCGKRIIDITIGANHLTMNDLKTLGFVRDKVDRDALTRDVHLLMWLMKEAVRLSRD